MRTARISSSSTHIAGALCITNCLFSLCAACRFPRWQAHPFAATVSTCQSKAGPSCDDSHHPRAPGVSLAAESALLSNCFLCSANAQPSGLQQQSADRETRIAPEDFAADGLSSPGRASRWSALVNAVVSTPSGRQFWVISLIHARLDHRARTPGKLMDPGFPDATA